MPDLDDVIRRCEVSRRQRQERCSWMKLWYLRGTDQAGPMARHNKIRAHIDLLSSYLYAPESTRFALQMPRELSPMWLSQADVARDVFLERWRNSGTDVLFAQLLEYALVYGAMWAKILPTPHGGVQVAPVYAGDVGVLREDVASLDGQEAFCHWFALSVPDVYRWTEGIEDTAKRDRIRGWAEEHASPGVAEQHYPNMISQLIVTAVQGPFPSTQVRGVTNLGVLGDERPQVDEPLVECVEIWQRQKFTTQPIPGTGRKPREFWDYLVTTRIGEWDVHEERNPVLPWQEPVLDEATGYESENPFIPVIPSPMVDYFWGTSEVTGLIQLQQDRETTFTDLKQLFQRQIDPSGLVSGVMGMTDEKARTLRTPGSWIQSTQGSGKIDTVPVPDVNDKGYQMMDRIDAMFADQAGIPEILAGAMGQGARSGDQVTAQANIAVGRIRRKALIVEDALEVLATRMFHLMQRVDDTMYTTPEGQKFLLAQLPAATTVKVSAHTASPVYRQELKQDAMMMLKAGAIDLVDFVELLDPPNKDEIKAKARELQKQKAELMKKRLEIEEKKAEKKGR